MGAAVAAPDAEAEGRVDAEDPANDVVGGMSPIDPVIARDPDVQSPHREGLIAVIERGHDIA